MIISDSIEDVQRGVCGYGINLIAPGMHHAWYAHLAVSSSILHDVAIANRMAVLSQHFQMLKAHIIKGFHCAPAVRAWPAAFGFTFGAVAHWKKLQRPTPGGPAGRAQV
jgi:hypothetical protein